MRALRHCATLVVLPAALIVLGVACDEDRQATPEGAVREFFEGLSKGDNDRMLDAICPDLRGDFGFLEFGLGAFGLSMPAIGYRDLEIERITENRDDVDLRVGVTLRAAFIETPRMELPFRATRSDGRWYICDDPFDLQQFLEQM
jgi:hypothetical protein